MHKPMSLHLGNVMIEMVEKGYRLKRDENGRYWLVDEVDHLHPELGRIHANTGRALVDRHDVKPEGYGAGVTYYQAQR